MLFNVIVSIFACHSGELSAQDHSELRRQVGIRWLYGPYMETGKKHSLAVLPGSVASTEVDEFKNSSVKSLPVSGAGSGILNGGLDPLDAVLRVGMCAEEFRRAVACIC